MHFKFSVWGRPQIIDSSPSLTKYEFFLFYSSEVSSFWTKASFPNGLCKKDVRKSNGISTNAVYYKNYSDLLTQYTFSRLQGEIEKMKCVEVLEQMDQEKYRLKDKEKSLVVTKNKFSYIWCVAHFGTICTI